MNDYQNRINKLVDDFVSQVTQVAREAARETLTAALGAANGAAARRRAGAIAGGAAPAAAAPAGRGAKRPKGAKRPQTEIESTKSRVHEFIQRNPGLRIEQINKELGTQTRDLSLPLKKLIAEGAIRTEGEKRSTQYFPSTGKPSRSEGAAAPRRRKKR